MKTYIFLITALLCFSTTGFSELTVEDLEKIRQINKETEVRLEKRISAEIKAQGELFSAELKVLSTEIKELSKRVDFQGQLIIALIVAFITVHLGAFFYQNNKRSSQEKEMEAMRQQHAQEMEAMRQQHAEAIATLHQKIEALETTLIARA